MPLILPDPIVEIDSLTCRDAAGASVVVDPNYATGVVSIGIARCHLTTASAVADAIERVGTLDTASLSSEDDRTVVDGVPAAGVGDLTVTAVQTDDVVTGVVLGAAAPLSLGLASSVVAALRLLAV